MIASEPSDIDKAAVTLMLNGLATSEARLVPSWAATPRAPDPQGGPARAAMTLIMGTRT